MNRRRPLVKKQEDPALAARGAALHALYGILRKRLTLEAALEREDIRRLSPRDAGFARQLLMLSLKRRGEMTALLHRMLEQPQKKFPAFVEEIFLLGMAQILWLNIPDHAAVDTSVSLARMNRAQTHAGLINAVLKRLARNRPAPDAVSPLENLPVWLREQLARAYGNETAEAIAAAHIPQAPLDITLKTQENPFPDALRLPTGTLRLNAHEAIFRMEGFSEGAWWVQDAAAALPVKGFGDVRGKTVLDLCAAPGGKTLQLAAAGANVIAVDRSARRMQRVHENLSRTQLAAECAVADAREFNPGRPVEAILLDAPCSATGTLRRNPDVAWHRQPEDVAALSQLQYSLLTHAATLLSPGGRIVYCVCSLLPAEGEEIIRRFLPEHKAFSLVPFPPESNVPTEWIAADGSLRTLPSHWPEQGGLDGFYIACLQKTEN